MVVCFLVRAGESLMKLVSDIKQYLILNDFHSVNDAISANSQLFRSTQSECDKKLMNLREAAAIDLYDLEEEYYTSEFKWISRFKFLKKNAILYRNMVLLFVFLTEQLSFTNDESIKNQKQAKIKLQMRNKKCISCWLFLSILFWFFPLNLIKFVIN